VPKSETVAVDAQMQAADNLGEQVLGPVLVASNTYQVMVTDNFVWGFSILPKFWTVCACTIDGNGLDETVTGCHG
jgi:hypothetical protein